MKKSKMQVSPFWQLPETFSQIEKVEPELKGEQKRKTTQDYKVQSLFSDFDFEKADSKFFEFPDPVEQVEPVKEKDDWQELV